MNTIFFYIIIKNRLFELRNNKNKNNFIKNNYISK